MCKKAGLVVSEAYPDCCLHIFKFSFHESIKFVFLQPKSRGAPLGLR